jgi:hypothetical protein
MLYAGSNVDKVREVFAAALQYHQATESVSSGRNGECD